MKSFIIIYSIIINFISIASLIIYSVKYPKEKNNGFFSYISFKIVYSLLFLFNAFMLYKTLYSTLILELWSVYSIWFSILTVFSYYFFIEFLNHIKSWNPKLRYILPGLFFLFTLFPFLFKGTYNPNTLTSVCFSNFTLAAFFLTPLFITLRIKKSDGFLHIKILSFTIILSLDFLLTFFYSLFPIFYRSLILSMDGLLLLLLSITEIAEIKAFLPPAGKETDLKNYLLSKQITERELQIIQAIVRGKTNREIAQMFNIAKRTVDNHVYSIFKKLDVSNRYEILQLYYRIVNPDENIPEKNL